jgi:hypothetical protein
MLLDLFSRRNVDAPSALLITHGNMAQDMNQLAVLRVIISTIIDTIAQKGGLRPSGTKNESARVHHGSKRKHARAAGGQTRRGLA